MSVPLLTCVAGDVPLTLQWQTPELPPAKSLKVTSIGDLSTASAASCALPDYEKSTLRLPTLYAGSSMRMLGSHEALKAAASGAVVVCAQPLSVAASGLVQERA